ncbi:hypothetical protein BD626DRAFT_196251 [Schizophyllum amplum]|uniref:Uncharacterized protein n=1 Tax=Schizophyllum amplum TaxID=97359 RepID=A0A550CMQ4_9AGAR|nr:hypothetical protein BD626DRAFT_196251 [Auriculariopsis ampla]
MEARVTRILHFSSTPNPRLQRRLSRWRAWHVSHRPSRHLVNIIMARRQPPVGASQDLAGPNESSLPSVWGSAGIQRIKIVSSMNAFGATIQRTMQRSPRAIAPTRTREWGPLSRDWREWPHTDIYAPNSAQAPPAGRALAARTPDMMAQDKYVLKVADTRHSGALVAADMSLSALSPPRPPFSSLEVYMRLPAQNGPCATA